MDQISLGQEPLVDFFKRGIHPTARTEVELAALQ